MKNIIIFGLLAGLCLPAFATSTFVSMNEVNPTCSTQITGTASFDPNEYGLNLFLDGNKVIVSGSESWHSESETTYDGTHSAVVNLFVKATGYVVSTDSKTFEVTGCPKSVALENGNPDNNIAGWGLAGYETPKVLKGQSVTDEAGFVGKCEKWEIMCADISRTSYYRNQMIEIGRWIISKGMVNLFPSFSYWINLAR